MSKQRTKLNSIVEAALKSPLYASRFPNPSLQPKCFEEFPIITKQELRYGYEQHILHPDAPSKHRESIYISPSGGTKGDDESKMYVNITDLRENELQRQLFADFVSKYNVINSSMIIGNLFGATSLYKSMDVISSVIEKCDATNICIERTCSNELTHKFLKRFEANGITSSPSRILYFVEYLEKHSIDDLYLKHLFYAGEALQDKKLKIIQNAIHCDNVLSVYGSSESGVWAVQNETVFGDKYFYYDPKTMHVEIEPSTNEIILTSLLKYRYPLIRYNTKDCGQMIELNDNYGVLELFGRNELSFSVGDEYHDLAKTEPLGMFLSDFVSFQIVIDTNDVDGADHVCVLLVNDDQNIKEEECARKLKKLIKSDPGEKEVAVECKFCEVEDLQISKISGKIKPIIDRRL